MSSLSGSLKLLPVLSQVLVWLVVSGAQWSYAQASPQLPLHTSGYQIVDGENSAVRLRLVNWYGFGADGRRFRV